MKRGSSGAEFNFLGDRVVKLAPAKDKGQRVMDQGLWLQKHQASGLPKVFQVYARSYVMERLIAPPLWALDHDAVLNRMFGVILMDVWLKPAEVKIDHVAMTQKFVNLCTEFEMPDTLNDLIRVYGGIKWDNLKTCLTHGDPTFDNVMFRESTGDLVFADPIPATPAIPDLRAVDLGKILQSALGWEEIRYGNHACKFRVSVEDVHNRVTDKNEWRATVFFAAIHLLRAFPYVTDDVRHKLKERVNAAIRLGV